MISLVLFLYLNLCCYYSMKHFHLIYSIVVFVLLYQIKLYCFNQLNCLIYPTINILHYFHYHILNSINSLPPYNCITYFIQYCYYLYTYLFQEVFDCQNLLIPQHYLLCYYLKLDLSMTNYHPLIRDVYPLHCLSCYQIKVFNVVQNPLIAKLFDLHLQ